MYGGDDAPPVVGWESRRKGDSSRARVLILLGSGRRTAKRLVQLPAGTVSDLDLEVR